MDGNGRSGLTLAPSRRFVVDLLNDSGQDTIIHWHGQTPPWKEDGFPWEQTPDIPAGKQQQYDYQPIAGTFWMHSHHALQEQALMAAPLIVYSEADMREDRQEIVLMLHDFSFSTPKELFAKLTSMPSLNQAPQIGMEQGKKPDLNDIRYDAYLANDRTLADPEVVRVDKRGRVRLRVINGAAATQFWLNLGELTGSVVAADGHPVRPVAGKMFPISMAQRLDILLDLPDSGMFPIIAQVEGLRLRTGIVLKVATSSVPRLTDDALSDAPPVVLSLERQLSAVHALTLRDADVTHSIVMDGKMMPYQWSLNGQYWPNVTPLMINAGQRVVVKMINNSAMAHPMHLHGHTFQVIELDGKPFSGARRDTIMVSANGSVTIAFDADNPGRWALHCHNLYHMEAGMLTELRYAGIIQ